MWMERLMQWDLRGLAELVDLSGVPPLLLSPAKCIGDGLDRGGGRWTMHDARSEEAGMETEGALNMFKMS